MANFVGAIEQFNPYIQQIPTEAYTKVGMFKEQQYEAGVQKVQESIDHIAGLDIANEGGREYLRSRVKELTKGLNKYSTVDFSNPNNVSQLAGLAKPLYQDENIVNDVINTGVYRKWAKDSNEAFKAGKMELGQYVRESADASQWLNSKAAGADYTGRSAPNLATKKDLVDRIVKIKKDGLEKNEFVYDINYSKDTPFYVKNTNKYYSEADFNNFITNAVITEKDREMLMNGHWYENQGVSTETLQKEDLSMYESKINANLKRIDEIKNDPLLYAGDKKAESEQAIKDLEEYNSQLKNGKIKFLQGRNLADPLSRDVFHRDLAETRFMQSLDILRDEVSKQEYQKNEQWFTDKQAAIEAAKAASGGPTKAGKKAGIEGITDEVALFTPVDPNAPKTELSLNTVQKGWQMANDQINSSMNDLIGKLEENGVNVDEYIAGWDQVQAGTKGGAAVNVPRFKNQEAKTKFYNLYAGLNFAYAKEAEDGNMDNQSFRAFVKDRLDLNDDDPNSKFTLNDKIVSDALNQMKGNTALVPRLEKLFADKSVVKTLASIDEALKNKKDMANAYREALMKSNSLTGDDMSALKKMSDDDLLSNNYYLDQDLERKRYGDDKKVSYASQLESDGTYSVYRTVQDIKGVGTTAKFFDNITKGEMTSDAPVIEHTKLVGGFKSASEADKAWKNEGQLSLYAGISRESFKKAEEFVRKTYSYVQENVNSTVINLKKDEDSYNAIKDGISIFLTRAKKVANPNDLLIDGVENPDALSSFSDIEIKGALLSNTEDIFNPNPMYEITFKAWTVDGEGKRTQASYDAKVSLNSFLATNPNYKTNKYAEYFAPAIYAQKDAYARIKATINPLEGSEASYLNRPNINPVFNRTNQSGSSEFVQDDPQGERLYGNQIQWETIPIEKDGKQTTISYQVVSLGQNTVLGNKKNKDGNEYAPGAFYVKLKIPTSAGIKTIFLKRPNGESFSFNSASNAHYTVRDLIFNNPDIKLDDIDPNTNVVDYFTTNPNTIRGIFNTQLFINGYPKLDINKLIDVVNKQKQKQQLSEEEKVLLNTYQSTNKYNR